MLPIASEYVWNMSGMCPGYNVGLYAKYIATYNAGVQGEQNARQNAGYNAGIYLKLKIDWQNKCLIACAFFLVSHWDM